MDVLIEASVDSQAQSASKISDEYGDDDYENDEYEESQEEAEDRGPVDITEDTLKQIERELCLVRLCWPRVELEDPYLAQLPESYSTNSDREKLLMWYAENFRKQYHTIYKDRKPLLLVCDNECGVQGILEYTIYKDRKPLLMVCDNECDIQKFVSTSVRPSKLPYPELYTWQGCAKFVSDHLQYEAPRRPLAMPVALRSPTWLMNVQRGNSFEYATLLVSLLLGQGYNAFVVSGYASREQVRCDMSMRACPYLPKSEERAPPPEPTDTSRYRMKHPPDFKSQLLLDLEAKEERKIEDESERRERERLKMLLEQERPLPDEYWGNRVHAWVVVLPEAGGARDHEVRAPFFIESTSGMYYSLDDAETSFLYHGVESLWNDRNYWVNMQPCTEACSRMDWDLTNIEHWEHLLPGEPWTMRGIDDDEEIDQDVQIQQDKHLDMPFSYVENIDIHSLDFERRYPNGTKTVHFKKTRVDFYAPYVQMDGLVRKITCYEDYDYRSPTQVHENYSNRADKLVESKKFHDNSVVVDSYERGRTDACKEHRYSANGNDRVDEERTLEFYDVVRIDGLSRIEAGPLHLIQYYVGRNDFLYYRHVEYTEKERLAQHETNYRTISRITEKYNRNSNVPAINDIAIREFAVAENEIRLKYHYDKYNITRATKTFVKPPMVERGDRPLFNPEFIRRYNPDPMALPEKQLDLFRELEKQLKDEATCLTLVADAEQEISAFLKIRSSEFVLPKLTVSLFDRNRNEEAKAGMFAQEEQLRAQSQREVEEDVDYLGPYLARLGNPPQLTKIQASHVREQCLNDLKKTLTDRANRISQEFETCSRELNKVQSWFTQTEGKLREEQERMLNETNEINFHLHTLDVRLQRHCDLASERYRKMLKTLRADKRLAVLYD